VIGVYAFSVIIVGVFIPFSFEAMLRKPEPLIIYGVTSHRAITLRSPWMVWTADDCCQEVRSYHLRRKSGAVSAEGNCVSFTLGSGESAMDFLLINDVEDVFRVVCACQEGACTLPYLAPRCTSVEPPASRSLRDGSVKTEADSEVVDDSHCISFRDQSLRRAKIDKNSLATPLLSQEEASEACRLKPSEKVPIAPHLDVATKLRHAFEAAQRGRSAFETFREANGAPTGQQTSLSDSIPRARSLSTGAYSDAHRAARTPVARFPV